MKSLFAKQETAILISYNINIGIDIIIKLIGSGGVIIAESITVIAIASLLYVFKNAGLINPIEENKNDATGSSNIKPAPIIKERTKLK